MSAHSSHSRAASPLSAVRARPLKGRVRPPGDKSISHRAFLFGLLACGETKVEGLLEGDDVLGTGKACEALGAVLDRGGPGQWRIRGPGLGAILPPLFLTPDYYYPEWAALGLEPPPPGAQWVRYGPDLLLVDVNTGQVLDVAYGVFYED